MEWLKNNYQEILAAIGAVYVAARTIVAITPTPKDDLFIDKVSVWLKALGKIFGLDLTQGVHNKDCK